MRRRRPESTIRCWTVAGTRSRIRKILPNTVPIPPPWPCWRFLEGSPASVPWEGAPGRDPLLAAAAKWLVEHFKSGDPPGWLVGPAFATSQMMAFHSTFTASCCGPKKEGVLTLPEPIRAAIPRHLIRFGERRLDFPSTTSGYWAMRYRDHKGQVHIEIPGYGIPMASASDRLCSPVALQHGGQAGSQ